ELSGSRLIYAGRATGTTGITRQEWNRGWVSLGPVKALLLENIHPEGHRLLEGAGLQVSERRSSLGEADLRSALPGVQVLGIRSKTRLTAAVLAAAPDLVAVGAFCIGTDQIDLAAASALGIAVFNA